MAKKPNKNKPVRYDKQQKQAKKAVAVVKPDTSSANPETLVSQEAIVAQTIHQQRARFALERVQKAQTADKFNGKEFKSYASAFPAMIHMNGLGQAAAFFRSKAKSQEHQRLYQLLSDWLTQPDQPYASYSDLLDGIVGESMSDYRLAQIEAIALMDWVKKFAKAFIAGD